MRPLHFCNTALFIPSSRHVQRMRRAVYARARVPLYIASLWRDNHGANTLVKAWHKSIYMRDS